MCGTMHSYNRVACSENPQMPSLRVPSVHCRRVTILIFLLLLVIFLVVDSVTQKCYTTEGKERTYYRLYCEERIEEAINFAHDNNSLPFFCAQENSTSSPWFLFVDPDTGYRCCQSKTSCVLSLFERFTLWLEYNHVSGFFATCVVCFLATLLFIPGSVLAIGVGAAFASALGLIQGVVVGSVAVWIGVSVGACASYAIGKFLLRSWTISLLEKYKSLRAIDAAMGKSGLKIVFLLRLSPIVPFAVFNYVAGCTCCTTFAYTVGTLAGIVPGTVAFVFVGGGIASAARGGTLRPMEDMEKVRSFDCTDDTSLILTISLVLGILATVIAVALIARYTRRVFHQMEETEEKQLRQVNPGNPVPQDQEAHVVALS